MRPHPELMERTGEPVDFPSAGELQEFMLNRFRQERFNLADDLDLVHHSILSFEGLYQAFSPRFLCSAFSTVCLQAQSITAMAVGVAQGSGGSMTLCTQREQLHSSPLDQS